MQSEDERIDEGIVMGSDHPYQPSDLEYPKG